MVLRLRTAPPDHWKDAKCTIIPLSSDYDPFFGVAYDSEGHEVDENEVMSHAIDFCNGTADGVICPVRHECLIFALTNNCKDGVWGGTSETTRKAIRKKYPASRNGKPNEKWKWQTEKESLRGLKKEQLLTESEE